MPFAVLSKNDLSGLSLLFDVHFSVGSWFMCVALPPVTVHGCLSLSAESDANLSCL